jgi:hypothetical protein
MLNENSDRFAVVHDAKGLITWPGWQRHAQLKEALKSRSHRIIYQPSYYELNDENISETFFRWIYDRGWTILYVDEVFGVAKGQNIPTHYHACITRGRERGITILSSTQRPKSIPSVVLSESEHFVIFHLGMPQDRERIEEIIDIDEDQIKELPKQLFYYCTQFSIAGPYKLNLGGSNASAASHAPIPQKHSAA